MINFGRVRKHIHEINKTEIVQHKLTLGMQLPVPTNASPHPNVHLKLGVVKRMTFLQKITAKKISHGTNSGCPV